ncbi:thiol reductant ABC exporter subunit CydC [Actinoplanes rectilineatus]|uniref:thiol reductant ABC exporter subunit CydC n=1 Tax=Actinoplanes rectilineatus TaxID=113571 RepID=UPI001FDF3590|nr:thiol reductant ABC exporter subunit CydC [Actinoplanes rectilineatus]
MDPRLLRHAAASRAGIGVLTLIGAGQTAATLAVAVALCRLVAGPRDHAVVLLAGAFAVRGLLAWLEQTVARRTAARVTDELRRSLVTAVLRRGPAWVAAFGAGRLTTVLGTGLDALRPWFSGYLPSLILGVLLPPAVVVTMAVVDPASATVALLTLPLIPVLGALIGWATQARAQQRWAADARLAGHFLDVVRGLATLKVFGRAERQTTVIAGLTDQHRRATLRVLRVAFLSSTALDLVGTLSVGLIAVQAGLRVAAGDMALAPALLVILLAPEAYRPLREMAARYHASTDAAAVIADVDEILTEPPAGGQETGDGEAATVRRALGPVAAGRWGVRAAALTARYPGSVTDAVRLDELWVRGGELVALRGPSGSGKTTALRVLAGLQPATTGAIAVGRAFYLPQHPSLPHARTVAEVFPPGTADEEIRYALRTTGLDTEVTGGTALGEAGRGVSSGQRQRLALAALLHRAERALLEQRTGEATEAVVTLLLDEPTAHLDADGEARMIARLREFTARGCAVLVVAHRPALLEAADRQVTIEAPAPATTVAATAPAAPAVVPARSPGTPQPPASPEAPREERSRWWARPATAVVLGAGSSLAGILLTGAAAWLLVRAATLPPVLTLSAAVVLVRGSAVARPLLRYLERLVAHDVAFARLGARRAGVYADLIPRVPGPRLNRRGDLLTRLVDDVDARVDGLLRGRLPLAAAIGTVTVAALAAGLADPLLAAPLALGVLVAGVLAPVIAGRLAARQEAATGEARARLRDAMVETVAGVEDLSSGNGASDVPHRRSRRLAELEARAARNAGLAAALAHCGWGAAATVTAIVLARSGLSAEWSAVALLGMITLGETVVTLPEAAIARRQAAGAEDRVASLAAEPIPAVSRPGDGGTVTTAPGVRVTALTAGWDRDREPAFRGLDLDLPAGSRTAVTGVSGSGKSTLAAVLARLLDPVDGTITIDGRDTATIPDAEFRRRVALVGDETGHVFASTVRENLRLAAPGASDPELTAALARVGLGDWHAGLPDGLGTWLGAGGSTLSGGQRRRLATARALLAEPGLLILDEPTEGIDEAGAKELMSDLLDAASGRTVLVFAHRTDGLDLVDRIVPFPPHVRLE